tara:strand:- start:2247 stop:2504 length:258 start_codon:yes stop_codon:yes gene_type:complete
MSKFKDWVYDGTVEDEYQTEYKDGIMVGKPVCEMVNVYDAVKKASDRFYDQTFEGNLVAAAEAKKESRYYEGFLDSTECPKYPGF